MSCAQRSRHTCHAAGNSSSGRNVRILDIIHDHSVGVKSPAKRAYGSFHTGDPLFGEAILIIPVEEERDHLFQEDSGQRFRVPIILDSIIHERESINKWNGPERFPIFKDQPEQSAPVVPGF